MESLSLYELNTLVRSCLERNLSGEYWLRAELIDVRPAAGGHCYVEFVQKDPHSNSLVAKARGNIWANTFRLLKPHFEQSTGQAFVSGLKVLVKVTVSFHELYGYSLVVKDIDPTYTLGDLARRRKEILRQLEAEGVLTLNKELPMPRLPQNIAIVSSPTAAGYGDFCHQLVHNPHGFAFRTELFPALMQGDRVEESILSALDKINARLEAFDVVVIIRGGGATSDLSGFDAYLLATACAQFPLPIITGIGHERDDTVLDSVAHTRVKTPTAAAELLISCMEREADLLDSLASRLTTAVRTRLAEEQRKLATYKGRIPAAAYRHIAHAKYRLDIAQHSLSQVVKTSLSRHRHRLAAIQSNISQSVASILSRTRHRLELLSQRTADASPQKQLARGYTLTLKGGKIVKDLSDLKQGDEITTRFRSGETVSVVKSSSPNSR